MKSVALVVALVMALAPAFAAQSTAAGEVLFKIHCAPCHGRDGTGNQASKVVGADLHSAPIQALSDAAMFDTIAYGTQHKKYMHAFVTRSVLTKNEVQQIVAYIRDLQSNKESKASRK